MDKQLSEYVYWQTNINPCSIAKQLSEYFYWKTNINPYNIDKQLSEYFYWQANINLYDKTGLCLRCRQLFAILGALPSVFVTFTEGC